jgi:hypothetical protein
MSLARRQSSRGLVLFVVLAAVALGLAVPAAPGRADPVYAFGPSGVNGAGFQNVVAYSPFLDPSGARPVLLGGDIAGVHRSVDGGRHWQPVNAGLDDTYVASLVFSPVTPGKVYAATDSAIYVSTDFGGHWTARPAPVNFDGNGTYQLPGVGEHPRSTGVLLALDESGPTPYLYAATHTQGVKRSSDDGLTWEAVALAGHHLRGIALDPANPDQLYVADADGGLQRSTNARGDFTFARVPGGPAIPEELEFIGGTLYVAGGAAGVFAYDGAWRPLNTGLPTGPYWESITGRIDPATGSTVLYIGCARASGGNHVLRSTDGGATWESLATGAAVTVNPEEFGHADQWWAAGRPYLQFTAPDSVTSDIAIDPDDPSRLLITGHPGAWAGISDAGGTSWWPAVHGLMVTVNMVVVADPKLAGRVYVGNMDWTFIPSADHGVTFRGDGRPAGAPTTGDVVALDPDGPAGQPSRVYLAASQRGVSTGTGKIYSNPDPIGQPTAWTDERLPVSADVQALGVGHAASGSRIILASVVGRGLYRKDGGSWTRLTGSVPFASGGFGSFQWVPGTPTVYAMDTTGVWRSNAAGGAGSWVRLIPGSADYFAVDSLARDPVRPGVLYVSDNGGIVRITGANTSTPVRETILPLDQPGPLAVTATGELLVHDRAGRLLRSADPGAAAPVFTDVANAFYAENNRWIRSLAIGADGSVYTASNRAGASRAPPLDGTEPQPTDTTAPSAPAGLTSPDQTVDSVSLAWEPSTDDVGVTAYRVLRNGAVVGSTAEPVWTDTALADSTDYRYRVQALDAAGNLSDPSAELTVRTLTPEDTTAPTAPGSLRGRLVSPTRVDLTWQASSDDTGVTGYRISRDGVQVATVATSGWTDTGMTAGARSYTVEAQDAAGHVSPAATTTVIVPLPAAAGLSANYYDTANFTSWRFARVDSTVNFSWGTGRPVSSVAPDTFSVRWTGRVIPPADGTWTFVTQSTDGVRLWVDGRLVINNWTVHQLTTNRGSISLTADRAYDIRLEYFEQTGSATMRLHWTGPGTSQRVVPSSQLLAV